MIVLGLDGTPMKGGGVALYNSQTQSLHIESLPPRSSSVLHQHIEQLLHKWELGWKDIQGLGTNSGPGSFTGLRVMATLARTWSLATSAPLVSLSMEECLVARSWPQGLSGWAVFARRERVNLCLLDQKEQSCVLQSPLKQVSVEQAIQRMEEVDHCFGDLPESLGYAPPVPWNPAPCVLQQICELTCQKIQQGQHQQDVRQLKLHYLRHPVMGFEDAKGSDF